MNNAVKIRGRETMAEEFATVPSIVSLAVRDFWRGAAPRIEPPTALSRYAPSGDMT